MADKNSAFPALNPTYNDNYCKSEQRSNSILNLTSACMENGFCVDNLYAVNTGEKKWERRTDVHTQQRSWIAFQVMENWRYPRKKWGFGVSLRSSHCCVRTEGLAVAVLRSSRQHMILFWSPKSHTSKLDTYFLSLSFFPLHPKIVEVPVTKTGLTGVFNLKIQPSTCSTSSPQQASMC